MTDQEFLGELAFTKEQTEECLKTLADTLPDTLNKMLAYKIRTFAPTAKLWKGSKYTHEGRIVCIRKVEP